MKKLFQHSIKLLTILTVFLVSPLSLLAEGTSNSPQVTLSPPSFTVTEGDSGTQTLNFTVSVNTCPDTQPIKIRVSTRNGTANPGSDYTPFTQNIQFDASLACTTSVPVSITVKGDTIFEGNEVFYLDIADNGTNTAQGFTFSNTSSTITITDDDTNPYANLRITKTNDKAPNKVVLGDQILYTIVATNDGPQSSTIQVTDTIPGGLAFNSVSDNSANFSCSHTGGTVTCTGSRDFAAGESVTISVLADVDAYDANNAIDLYRNTAQVSSPAGKPDDTPSNNTATSDVRIHEIDLRVTKSTSTPTVANIGDPIVFTLTARNNSLQESTISLTDVLPASMTLVGVTINSGPSNFNCSANLGTNTVTCGGSHKFELGDVATITINATAAANGRHYNTATVTSPEGYPESNTNNNHASTHVDVGNTGPNDVSINKSVSAAVTIDPNTGLPAYYVGETVHYTVTATVYGIDSKFAINDFKYNNGTTGGGALIFSNLNCTTTDGTVLTRPNINSNTVNQCMSAPLGPVYNVHDGTTYTLTIDAELKKIGTICNAASAYKGFPNGSGGTNWSLNRSDQVCITVIAHEAPPVLNATNFNITPDVAITPIDLKTVTTDPDTPIANLTYSNATGLPTGLSMNASGVISGTYVHPARGPVHAPFTVTVTVTDPQGLTDTDSFTITLVPPTLEAFYNIYQIPIQSSISGNLITEITFIDGTYGPDNGVDILVTNVTDISFHPSTLTWGSDGSFTYDTNNTATNVSDEYTYTIEDKYGQTDTSSLIVKTYTPPIGATDDNYLTGTNTPLSGNVITDNAGNGSDVGDGLQLVTHTTTSHGSLTVNNDGSFTYNPDLDYTGNDSFTYGITDLYGQESNATVTIVVGSFALQQYADFYLVNPPSTRNIIGNFLTAGNTVECVTDKLGDTNESNSFNGTCTNNTVKNNNNFMTKYIDVDGNATAQAQKTWNSSSSTFTLPSNYDQDGGNGIVWAALFWQGSVNNRAYYKQRRAYEDGGSYNYEYITSNQIIDTTNTDANKILMKLDGALNYTSLESDTFYYDSVHADATINRGGYYAAYANITTWLRAQNLSNGTHTLTVANITSNEGREKNVGNYAGWSLVVIYKEDVSNGKPRNISIYNGYQAIGYPGPGSTSTTSSKVLPISGFKLPKAGPVNASISAFVGEGEEIYGGSAIVYDKMILADNNDTNYSIASGSNNVFDATLAGISRSIGNDNDVVNTNGIDIDTYDISSAMTTIRNNDGNVSSISIGIASKDTNTNDGDDSDYVTASMLAFSAELYKPQICYDYTLDIDGYVLNSDNNKIDTSFGDQGMPLTTRISIKSEEGDFVLRDVNITYDINNTAQVRYLTDSVAIAPNGIYSYIPAGAPPGLNQAYNQTINGFGLYIGEGANPVPGPGGSIDAFETRYIRLQDEMLTADVNTSFTLSMKYLVNYGSGDLELTQNFDATTECNATGDYVPARGLYNVTSAQANDATGKPYNLYTEVASRDFKVKVFSYDSDYETLKDVDNAVEIELFNAGHFGRDVNVSCYNPDGNITAPRFVEFNSSHVQEEVNIRYNGAIRNTGFRVWIILKPDGSILENNCTSRTTPTNCFNNLYSAEYIGSDSFCTAQCAIGNNQCYACLRKYYGKPICSRDNFAVRPESFLTTLIDSGQNDDITIATQTKVADTEDSTPAGGGNVKDNNATLVAGYEYRFDINATNYLSDAPVHGYHQYFNQSVNANYAKMTWNPPPSPFDDIHCNDTSDQNISALLFNGSSISGTTAQMHKVTQIGRYAFELRDENWTAVDWNPTLLTHHQPFTDFSNDDDCTSDGTVDAANSGNKQGCYIDSVHTHPNGTKYEKLFTQYYPYDFETSGLTIGAGPTLDRPFVYVNDLNSSLYPATGDENMSYNVQGTFTAIGFDDAPLSNFVTGCYAEDLNLTMDYTFLTGNGVVPFRYDVANTNPTTTTELSKIQAKANNIPVQNNLTTAHISQPATAFAKDANGSVGLDLGFNFDRDASQAVNPRRIAFKDFNISYAISPSLTVNTNSNHIIESNISVNDNVSFFYAKLTPGKTFYDGITAISTTTPVAVDVYCDLGRVLCAQAGVNTAQGQTSDFNWWRSWNHDNTAPQQDGNIVFQATNLSNLSTGLFAVPVDNRGENTALTLTRDNNATLPLTVPVNLQQYNIGLIDYTDRWLIYNPGNIAPLPPLFKVRFIGGANWTGHGETGSVVGGGVNNAKSGRVEW